MSMLVYIPQEDHGLCFLHTLYNVMSMLLYIPQGQQSYDIDSGLLRTVPVNLKGVWPSFAHVGKQWYMQ